MRYDLPVPLLMYLVGAGATVVLSFAVLVIFLRTESVKASRVSITRLPVIGALTGDVARVGLQGISLLLFVLVIVSGFFGDPSPTKNFAPTFVWVIWWVGFSLFTALVVNIWPLVNPWRILHDLARDALSRRASSIGRAPLPYPDWLGRWPAGLLFLAFAWLELVPDFSELPHVLACLVIAYSIVTWLGMALFGRNQWLENGECFQVAFSIFGRFAPFGRRGGEDELRVPGTALNDRPPTKLSEVAFVFLLLTTVTFDGLAETPLWAGFLEWLTVDTTVRPVLLWLQGLGVDLLKFIKTLALIAIPLGFLGIYHLVSVAMAWAGGGTDWRAVARAFAMTLVPIAIAYHLAHYYTYLLLAGQLIIPLVSDPLSLGWDLFGTAGRQLDLGVVDATTVWYVALTTIVAGHVLAVYVAHLAAIRHFQTTGAAFRSQIPMMILMVAYTMSSLWIISQPIVN